MQIFLAGLLRRGWFEIAEHVTKTYADITDLRQIHVQIPSTVFLMLTYVAHTHVDAL